MRFPCSVLDIMFNTLQLSICILRNKRIWGFEHLHLLNHLFQASLIRYIFHQFSPSNQLPGWECSRAEFSWGYQQFWFLPTCRRTIKLSTSLLSLYDDNYNLKPKTVHPIWDSILHGAVHALKSDFSFNTYWLWFLGCLTPDRKHLALYRWGKKAVYDNIAQDSS